MADYLKISGELKERIISDRRRLHEIPETGFELENTVKYVMDRLYSIGLTPIRIGKSGVVAEIVSKAGKCVMLRADMDALPMREESGVEFASKNGNMHACGHDMHTAMLLGAAEILFENRDKIDGRILLCFQGAEEILCGAKDMLDAGLIEKYKPDMAIMLHTLVGVSLDGGTVVVSSGGIGAPSADFFKITVYGHSSHAATPHLAKDALFCAVEIYRSLIGIVTRELSIDDGAVLSIGSLVGGKAGNVISDNAVINGIFRTFSDDARSYITERVRRYSRGMCELYGMSCDVDFYSGCPVLKNDTELSARVYACVKDIIGRKCVLSSELGTRGGGSEDFAYFSHIIPSLMIGIAAGSNKDGYKYTAHNPKVVFDEGALATGASVYANCAVHLLK